MFVHFPCRYSLNEFTTARRTAVVRAFLDALTHGGPGGTPKPIEMHAHDPLRYIRLEMLFFWTFNFH